MRGVAWDSLLSLPTLPLAGPVRIAGLDAERLPVEMDLLPPDAPIVIRCGINAAPAASVMVTDVLRQLETVALRLFPAWLPNGANIQEATGLDRRVVRMLARRRAATSEHFGPFLADVAEAALLEQPRSERFAPEIRARGLRRVLADAYNRDGLVLLVEGSTQLADDEEQTAAAALSWLANHGFGVWIANGALGTVDRFPTVAVDSPSAQPSVKPAVPPQPAVKLRDIPAPLGQPHPLSEAEQSLARILASCEWAVGHHWNQEPTRDSLLPTIRVDLIWPAARCVVEIDGPDHRGAQKYAADRRRDNALAVAGFRVLRFTNDQVVEDMPWVLATIRAMLSELRLQEGNPS